MESKLYEYFDHSIESEVNKLFTPELIKELKSFYVERWVDNMSTKDLVQYVSDDLTKWVDSLTYNEAIVEFQEYWDEYFTDTIEEVRECINDN